MATGFMADASGESVRFAAKNGALSNAARRAIWLKTWSGDTLSKNKLCSIPFSGAYVFGPVLDDILEKAADKKRGFPQERPKSKPSYSFRRKPQKTPEYSGKGKTGRWSYPKGGAGRQMATTYPKKVIKLQRIEGGLGGPKSLSTNLNRHTCKSTLRQHDSSSSPSASRSHKTSGTSSARLKNLYMGQTRYRSLRHTEKYKGRKILLPESIGRSRKGGCPVSTLGHGIGIRISPNTLDPGSSQKDPEGTYETNLSGTFLAQEELVSSARETSSRRPGYAALGTRSPQPGPSNTHKPRGSKTLSMDPEWGMLKSQGFTDSHLYHTKWQETGNVPYIPENVEKILFMVLRKGRRPLHQRHPFYPGVPPGGV
ncbi:hypothetical protein PRIEUP_LOCUS1579 [Pristimantis euphronides]